MHRARQRTSEARRILSRSSAPARQRRRERRGAQISSNSSSLRSAVSRLESSMPLGIRLGSSTTPQPPRAPNGPRPASSQPPPAKTPRLISARSRRKLAARRNHALWHLVCLFRTCRESCRDRAQANRAAQPGTRGNARYSSSKAGVAAVARMEPRGRATARPMAESGEQRAIPAPIAPSVGASHHPLAPSGYSAPRKSCKLNKLTAARCASAARNDPCSIRAPLVEAGVFRRRSRSGGRSSRPSAVPFIRVSHCES